MVKKTTLKRIRGFQKMFDVLIEEEEASAFGGRLICRWFNAHWVEKMIVQGHRLVVYGRPKRSGSNVVMNHPEFEVVEEDADESIHLNRIVPIHSATEGVTPRMMRWMVWQVLERLCDDEVEQLLPPKLDAMPRAWAIRQMHFPESFAKKDQARRHLVLEEFLAMQLAVGMKRREQRSEHGEPHAGPDAWMRQLHESLPFPLTGAQQRAIAEIRDDLASPRAMNRLLHGDVGSGKTFVAMSAMLLCAEAGYQAALMAPTQILAEQHYLNFRRWLDPLGIRVALRTGNRREDNGEMPLFNQTPRLPAPEIQSEATEFREGSARFQRVEAGVPPASLGATYAKRRLPHFERPHAIYAVTFTTKERAVIAPEGRTEVLSALRHFHGQRYDLRIACVMPDHVHVILQPYPKRDPKGENWEFWSVGEIMHSIKSFTSKKINALHGEEGAFWEKEYFDHLIQTEKELEEQTDYIRANPERAHLVRGSQRYLWLWERGVDSGAPQDAERDTLEACAPLADISGSPVKDGSEGAETTGENVVGNRAEDSPEAKSHRSFVLPATEPHILIGTHALLYEGAGFTRLGLAVVDEQHKFGVMQRARLRAQGVAPDVLVMTATPIPRTLTMTYYGDLDVSTLDELPAGRGKIITGVRPPTKLPDAAKFIREQLEAGRQCYIVYPLIDETEKQEAKAAAAEIAKWSELLAPMKCELLHGRVAPEEKEATMRRFREGETKVLVATTVIEVGVDVPNATVMLVENAERFGLAQLHQLRGRIGRGQHKSYCILITTTDEPESMQKLEVLARTTDGFEIADADLRLRGPGDMLGTAQSGLPPLLLGDLLNDSDLMKLARNHAFLIFEHDPEMQRPEHAGCRVLLETARQATHAQVS